MKKEERARMRRLARWLLPPVLLCAGYALWVGLTGRGPACPIHAALGLWCPLCGASRMGLALLRLDLPGALRFAQPAGVRFFGAALSGCVPAQRDFVFYAGSLPFRAIKVMPL